MHGRHRRISEGVRGEPMRYGLVGVSGRMGAEIRKAFASHELCYTLDIGGETCEGTPEVMVDFSLPSALGATLDAVRRFSCALVLGTTGIRGNRWTRYGMRPERRRWSRASTSRPGDPVQDDPPGVRPSFRRLGCGDERDPPQQEKGRSFRDGHPPSGGPRAGLPHPFPPDGAFRGTTRCPSPMREKCSP